MVRSRLWIRVCSQASPATLFRSGGKGAWGQALSLCLFLGGGAWVARPTGEVKEHNKSPKRKSLSTRFAPNPETHCERSSFTHTRKGKRNKPSNHGAAQRSTATVHCWKAAVLSKLLGRGTNLSVLLFICSAILKIPGTQPKNEMASLGPPKNWPRCGVYFRAPNTVSAKRE